MTFSSGKVRFGQFFCFFGLWSQSADQLTIHSVAGFLSFLIPQSPLSHLKDYSIGYDKNIKNLSGGERFWELARMCNIFESFSSGVGFWELARICIFFQVMEVTLVEPPSPLRSVSSSSSTTRRRDTTNHHSNSNNR